VPKIGGCAPFGEGAGCSSNTKEKNLLNSNISSTRLHKMAKFSPLTVEIGSGVWPSPGLLLPTVGILPGVKFTIRPSLAFFYIGSVTGRLGCELGWAPGIMC